MSEKNPAPNAIPDDLQAVQYLQNSCRLLRSELSKVIVGQMDVVEQILIAILTRSHALLVGVPGLAKTMLVRTIADVLHLSFKRVQFTPDLLPSDILGVSVYNPRDQVFFFHAGPVFTHVLLADEINRASPRTQSALLEAMGEQQVSLDGEHRALPELFFVIATQNPVEFRGTYPLPEAQMDRFAVKLSLGYVKPEVEVAILSAQARQHPLEQLRPCATVAEALALKSAVQEIRLSEELKRYAVDLVGATRTAAGVQLGASPRGSLALTKAAQALALFDGQEFVTPEHIQELAVAVIAHRLVMEPQARFSGATAESVVEGILKATPAPA